MRGENNNFSAYIFVLFLVQKSFITIINIKIIEKSMSS